MHLHLILRKKKRPFHSVTKRNVKEWRWKTNEKEGSHRLTGVFWGLRFPVNFLCL